MTLRLIEFVWIWNESQRLTTPKHHRIMGLFLSRCFQGKKRQGLLMAFRNSGKSTLVGLFCAWVLLIDPSTRFLILSADHELAKKMVRNIKRIIERHPLTGHLKPKAKDQWASDRFTVVRNAEWRDPSVMARGLGANITGSRADIIICDDVEVPKTCKTSAKRIDLRQKLSELDFVLVPGGMQLFVGTPHTFETIYDVGADGFLQNFDCLRLPILDENGRSAWPERFSDNQISEIEKRSGPMKFLSQMMLTPTQLKEGRLDTSRLQIYEENLSYTEVNSFSELKIGDVKMVSASTWWDPAFGRSDRGDHSVIACVFQDGQGRYFLHDLRYLTVRDLDQSAEEQCDQVAHFLKENHLPSICVETNGLGRFLPELLKQKLTEKHLPCAVLSKNTSAQKDVRIMGAFDALLANKSLWISRVIFASPFVDEMKNWVPAGKGKDDALDAVAGCILSEPIRLPHTHRPSVKTDWRFGKSLPTLSLDEVKI